MDYQKRRKLFSFIILTVLITLVVVAGLLFKRSVSLGNLSKKVTITQPGYYEVAQFNDGDTITVDMNGNIETVRFIGVDTPETHRPNTPVQCFGPQASEFIKKLIGNQKVRLQADPINTNRDRYGRLLRYVYLPDGRLVEEELIKNGYAFSYTQFPFQKTEQFDQLEQQAKDSNLGLWASCNVNVADNGREQTEYR